MLYYKKISGVGLNVNYSFFSGIDTIKSIAKSTDNWQSQDLEKLKAKVYAITERNEFCFLNKSVTFSDDVEWQSGELEKLWLYNLNYFDYAFDLGVVNLIENDVDIFDSFKCLVSDWIDKNQEIGSGVGWEPYPVSLRIVNWIYAFNLFADNLKGDMRFYVKYVKSIAIQAEFLYKNIEYHVRKNHLIKNGKALFLAGVFFQGQSAEKWKTKGINILISEAREQILNDGGHYERSPMYHLIVLQDYLEMYIFAKRIKFYFPVEEKLLSMMNFMLSIIHLDNQIPLFNDSALGIAKEPAEIFLLGYCSLNGLPGYDIPFKVTLYTVLLTGVTKVDKLEAANCKWPTLLKDSGFCTFRSKGKDKFMIISYKDPSPNHSPGHSHSDIFSYELSLGDKRFIVDSGTNNYLAGEWRDYFRGTRAHNTLTVNGQNQSEVWGAFGIARRARLEDVRFSVFNSDSALFEGTLKGFPGLNSICHQRCIYFLDDQMWFVFDTIKASIEDLRHYTVESFIHVHPDRSVKPLDFNDTGLGLVIDDEFSKLQVCPTQISTSMDDNNELNLKVIRHDEKVIQGWYSSEFGERKGNSTIVISKKGRLPIHIGYVLFPFTEDGFITSTSGKMIYADNAGIENNVQDIEITTADRRYLIRKDATGAQCKKLKIKD